MAPLNFHRKITEEKPPPNATGICIDCDSLEIPPQPSPPSPPTGGIIFTTPPPKHHHSPLSLPLKISLVVLIITFSLFLLYTLYKFYTVWYRSRRRRSPPPSPENQETSDEFLDHDILDHPIWYIRTIGLQPSVISAITVVKYNKTDGLIEGTNCSVCLSEFEEDETLRLLPKCNHAFHLPCIDTWLRSHTNCPLCRAGIVKSGNNLSDSGSGQPEETQLAISIPEDEERERERVSEEDSESSEEEKRDVVVGGSGTNSDFLIMRRSVSLDDYAACRVRSDLGNHNHNHNHNNYYSDRHDVQVQSVDGDLGFDLIKVEQTAASNLSTEGN